MTEKWKAFQHNPNYEISSQGRMRNKRTGRVLEGNSSNRSVEIKVNDKRKSFAPSGLKAVFNSEQWVPVNDFPNYEVSDRGNVRKVGTEELVGGSSPNVSLGFKNGKWKNNISRGRLVGLHFLDVPEPVEDYAIIHLDCDCYNNKPENLMWIDKQWQGATHQKLAILAFLIGDPRVYSEYRLNIPPSLIKLESQELFINGAWKRILKDQPLEPSKDSFCKNSEFLQLNKKTLNIL